MTTFVIIHRKENLNKCSVWPLHIRDDFRFYTFPYEIPKLDPKETVRLGLGGSPLSMDDSRKSLLVLDATWRLAPQMELPFGDIPVRSIPSFVTAYPRIAGDKSDPKNGLATIEAIYCAHTIMGWNTDGLLQHYRWKEQFLQENRFS